MNRIKILDNYCFRVDITNAKEVDVKLGQNISLDSVLGLTEQSVVLERLDVINKLKIPAKDIKKYINVISGERVVKGDVIAKRSVIAGLGYYEVKASCSGNIDLSEIKEGIVKISEYKKMTPIQANCEGVVTSIVPEEFIEITTKCLAVELFKVNQYKDCYSKFVYIPSHQIKLHQSEINNNIVFIDGEIDEETLKEVILDKPKLIVLPTLDYISSLELNNNILIMLGYNSTGVLNKTYRNILNKFYGINVNYSRELNSLVFPIRNNYRLPLDILKDNIGSYVICLNDKYLFEEGKIVDVTEEEVKVNFDNKRTGYFNYSEVILIN